MRLGALPTAFTKYWIDRFPRLISHSYHSLESCANEHTFAGYYPVGFKFAKPDYFYEITEDFKPFDGSNKARDSPKRFNNRYKPQDYPNFVMDRKPNQKQNGAAVPIDLTNYQRTTKKGAYNFHRFSTNLKNIMNEITRSDNPRRESEESIPEDTQNDADDQTNRETKDETVVWKIKSDENTKPENVAQNVTQNVVQNVTQNAVQNAQNVRQRAKSKKKKQELQFVENECNPEPEMDEEGFVKVKYRGGTKKQRESQNENVQWVLPTKEK